MTILRHLETFVTPEKLLMWYFLQVSMFLIPLDHQSNKFFIYSYCKNLLLWNDLVVEDVLNLVDVFYVFGHGPHMKNRRRCFVSQTVNATSLCYMSLTTCLLFVSRLSSFNEEIQWRLLQYVNVNFLVYC